MGKMDVRKRGGGGEGVKEMWSRAGGGEGGGRRRCEEMRGEEGRGSNRRSAQWKCTWS